MIDEKIGGWNWNKSLIISNKKIVIKKPRTKSEWKTNWRVVLKNYKDKCANRGEERKEEK
jgi:hypothetical protein